MTKYIHVSSDAQTFIAPTISETSSKDAVKPIATTVESLSSEMNTGYDDVDGTPGINADLSDQRILEETSTKVKQPMMSENQRSPYTEKSELHIAHSGKPAFGVSDQVRNKPCCSVENG